MISFKRHAPKFASVLVAVLLASAISGLPKIPQGAREAVFGILIGLAALIFICAFLLSRFQVLEDFPLSNTYIQYSFVSVTSLYLGDSLGDTMEKSLADGSSLNASPVFAAILVGVFCVASVTESQIAAAKKEDCPRVGLETTKKRTIDVIFGTIVTMVIPMGIGACFYRFF